MPGGCRRTSGFRRLHLEGVGANLTENLSIGPFVLADAARSLWFGKEPIPLPAQAIDVLAAIARSADGVTATQLWPLVSCDAVLDEERLCDVVGDINNALGRWSAEWYVAWYPEATLPRFALVDATRRTNPIAALPTRRTDIIGRDEAIERIVAQVRAHRFVTILAAGGMGKTTVALAVAHAAAAGFPDGVHFVDLAPVVDASLVAQGVASALGCATAGVDALAGLQKWARQRVALVVLDSCEHVIDAASVVAEALVGADAHVSVLATSREPLRAGDEWLHRLAPMRLPQAGEAVSARNAVDFPALRLFIERATSADARFALRDEDVPLLVSLCARLDGIALAIEIVAARVGTLGLASLASQLEDRLLRLPASRGTSPARHATLTALLDWSYHLLSSAEQHVLQRLSVFRGGFTIDAAIEVVADNAVDAASVQESILDLIAKSLVASPRGASAERLRLLDTTRAYAAGKLDEAGERDQAQRRHAQWLATALAEAESDWNRVDRSQWVGRYAPLIDDVRAALDWAFTSSGDVMLGAQLTLASFALGRQMLLIDEFMRRVAEAVMALGARAAGPPSGRSDPATGPLQMRLKFLLGCMGTSEPTRVADVLSTLERTVASMPETAATADRFSAYNSMWGLCISRGDFLEGGEWAGRLERLAEAGNDPIARLVAGRIQAQTLHFLGRHADATAQAQRVIAEAWRTIPLAYNPSPVELRVSMRVVLARALWMQGFPDRAAEMAREAMTQASTDSPISQYQAVVMGSIVVALWSGLDTRANELSDGLSRIDNVQGFGYWLRWGTRFGEVLALRSGAEIAAAHDARFLDESDLVLADHLATMDERWLSATCIHRVATGVTGWCAPEVLRRQGERALREDLEGNATLGEHLLERSLAVARQQGAASWELRTATSLARHWHSRDRAGEARALLEPVHERFTEGFETADLRAASRLLESL